MLRTCSIGVLAFAALVGRAAAQVVPAPAPPPPTAAVVNFDELVGLPTELSLEGGGLPVFPPDTYVNRGLQITGFGNSGGIGFNLSEGFNPPSNPPPPGISFPNILFFASIAPTAEGGLVQSPETLPFYPPALSLQFDVTLLGSFGLQCMGSEVLRAEIFAPGGALLSGVDFAPPDGDAGSSVLFNAPAPGIERMRIRSLSPCLGLLEAFSIDNIAFVTAPLGASKCAEQQAKAAGDAAKDQAKCYSKAAMSGLPVDDACLAKAQEKFAKNFPKGAKAGDCPTGTDADTLGGAVNTFALNLSNAVTGGASGPDVCFGLKLKQAGTKAGSVVKCFSAAAKKGTVADPACAQKAIDKFNKSLKKCGTPEQLASVESLIDQFAVDVGRVVTVPSTSTTTTTTSTTTSTTVPPLGPHLSFTTTIGSANCNIGPNQDPPTPEPPLSGTLYSDTAATTPIASLGLGCLYIGGGNAGVAPSQVPENATTILDSADGLTLTASFGTGQADCSRGLSAIKHCVSDPDLECADDDACGGLPGNCQGDVNCYFGPPVPINGFPASCVVNTFATDASGTLDLATGTSTVNIQLASRVFLTLGLPTACPVCEAGFCNYGERQGLECTSNNLAGTTLDCLPQAGIFIATLPVDLSPLSNSTNLKTADDGNFCSPQQTPGAFGQPDTRAIQQVGQPGGDLTDGQPHASILVSNFCIPATLNGALDNLGNLPGPGTLSLPGNAQYFSSPSGAFLMP